jgi:hypothetical protein
MTTVSSAGDSMEAKRRAASAAMKRVEDSGRLFKRAFVDAEVMLAGDMSMPREDLKREERVMVKRPEPEYASIRWVIL